MVRVPWLGPSNCGWVWTRANESIFPPFRQRCWGSQLWVRSKVQSATSVVTVSSLNGNRRPAGNTLVFDGQAWENTPGSPAGWSFEAPATRIGAVVVVVGPVLHHQEDHVLDRTQIPSRPGRPWPPSPAWKRPPPRPQPAASAPPPRGCSHGQQLAPGDPPPWCSTLTLLSGHVRLRSRKSGPNVSGRMGRLGRNPGSPAALPGHDRHPITGFGPATRGSSMAGDPPID